MLERLLNLWRKYFQSPWRGTWRYICAFLAGPVLFATLVVLAVQHVGPLTNVTTSMSLIEAFGNNSMNVTLTSPLPTWTLSLPSWFIFYSVLFIVISFASIVYYVFSQVILIQRTDYFAGRGTWPQMKQWVTTRVPVIAGLVGVAAVIAWEVGWMQVIGDKVVLFAWSTLLVISLLIWLFVVAPWASPKRRDIDRSWSQGSFAITILTLLSLVVIFGVTPKRSFEALLGCWLTTLGLLILLTLYVGYIRNNRLLGIFIDSRNRVSLANFQMLIWTILIASTFLALALGNIAAAPYDYNRSCNASTGYCFLSISNNTNVTAVPYNYLHALDITIPATVLALAGIAATALVVPPHFAEAKKRLLRAWCVTP